MVQKKKRKTGFHAVVSGAVDDLMKKLDAYKNLLQSATDAIASLEEACPGCAKKLQRAIDRVNKLSA